MVIKQKQQSAAQQTAGHQTAADQIDGIVSKGKKILDDQIDKGTFEKGTEFYFNTKDNSLYYIPPNSGDQKIRSQLQPPAPLIKDVRAYLSSENNVYPARDDINENYYNYFDNDYNSYQQNAYTHTFNRGPYGYQYNNRIAGNDNTLSIATLLFSFTVLGLIIGCIMCILCVALGYFLTKHFNNTAQEHNKTKYQRVNSHRIVEIDQ